MQKSLMTENYMENESLEVLLEMMFLSTQTVWRDRVCHREKSGGDFKNTELSLICVCFFFFATVWVLSQLGNEINRLDRLSKITYIHTYIHTSHTSHTIHTYIHTYNTYRLQICKNTLKRIAIIVYMYISYVVYICMLL